MDIRPVWTMADEEREEARQKAGNSAQPCGCDPGAFYVCGQHRPKTEFIIKDSGVRQTFASGSLRDTTDGKINWGKVTEGPMLKRWAEHLTAGAKKYPDVSPGIGNWTLISSEEERVRYRESAFRHFMQWYVGEKDEDHAAAVFFNINGVEYLDKKRREENTK